MKNINIKELARQLKLSVSTVSKALHDSYEISEKTKKRVHASAAKLNYIPNPYASSLRGRKSKNIGIVIPEVADSFFSLAINGIESVAKEEGYHVLICLTHENFENERAILKEFQGGRVDGVLMSISGETVQSGHVKDLLSNDIPLVFFDRVCEEIETGKITTNDFESAYTATEHLIEQGCGKIVFLSISKSLSMTKKRIEGYMQAMDDHGLESDEKNVILFGKEMEQDCEVLKKTLKQKLRPDGIIASVEKLTSPIYNACASLNLKIPQDVKVVCFSNLETASLLDPPLTTITQPAFEMGKAAASLLFKALSKSTTNLGEKSLEIPSSLIVRGSTA